MRSPRQTAGDPPRPASPRLRSPGPSAGDPPRPASPRLRSPAHRGPCPRARTWRWGSTSGSVRAEATVHGHSPQMMSPSASSLAAEKFSSWVCW
ncbi:hypothetical protein BST20_13800 [Mycobacterium branderi]|uniref:Uncharacterized protein n=1 Tax=Mycobacterium branderi TaxID=43348 RepID=A0AA91LX36_9MYCO|nr:hypothetical protein BST20_13800 [Mycobacterium branderi]